MNTVRIILLTISLMSSYRLLNAMEEKRTPQKKVALPPCDMSAVMRPQDYAQYSQIHAQEIEEQKEEQERLELLHSKEKVLLQLRKNL